MNTNSKTGPGNLRGARIEVAQGDGSDGHNPGTYGYIIRQGQSLWCDGGYVDRRHALSAAKKQLAELGEAA